MAVAVQLIRQVHIHFSVTYIQYYAVPSPCRAIWYAQAQGKGWQAISVETGVAVVRDRGRCVLPELRRAEWAFRVAIFTRKPSARCARLFSSPHHFCTWQIHFLLNRRNHLKVEREHSHRFGYYQRNDKEMFSLVSQEVMVQPPTAHRQRTRKSSTTSATSS